MSDLVEVRLAVHYQKMIWSGKTIYYRLNDSLNGARKKQTLHLTSLKKRGLEQGC